LQKQQQFALETIRYIQAKTILSRLKGVDNFFGISYNMNLYRGCQHGCIYCDTRSECYGINDISTIAVKENAIELLQQELHGLHRRRGTVGTGSMNDPYMPIEKELVTTRKALKVIASEKFPVHIITKSDLVVRDTDLLQEISNVYAAVSLTITTANDRMARQLEPQAPPSSSRFAALYKLSQAGLYTGITLMPVLPFINDTVNNIETILQQAKDAGVSYVIPMFGVTLRKGSRDYFYRELDKLSPTIKEKYIRQYQLQYECFSPDYYRLHDTFMELSSKLGIATKMEFYQPEAGQQLSLF